MVNSTNPVFPAESSITWKGIDIRTYLVGKMLESTDIQKVYPVDRTVFADHLVSTVDAIVGRLNKQ